MILSVREMEILKLLCWCKNIPDDVVKRFTGTCCERDIAFLEFAGLITKSRDGRNIRPRMEAQKILAETGFICKQENKPQTNPSVLLRRNISSTILFTFHAAGISVFNDRLNNIIDAPVYAASFAIRQGNSGNPYGSTKFYGVFCTPQEAFLVLYADDAGVYFQKELALFHNLTEYSGIQKTAIIIMGASTASIGSVVIRAPSKNKRKNKYNTNSFPEIYATTTLPVHFIPVGDAGAQALKFMLVPNYREAIAKAVLKGRYRPPYPDADDTDTIHVKPPYYPAVVAADMDVKRIDRALEYAWKAGYEKIVLYALKEQIPFLKTRYGNEGKAEILGIDVDFIKDTIGHDIQFKTPLPAAYVTGEGRCFDVTDISAYRKAGTKNQP